MASTDWFWPPTNCRINLLIGWLTLIYTPQATHPQKDFRAYFSNRYFALDA